LVPKNIWSKEFGSNKYLVVKRFLVKKSEWGLDLVYKHCFRALVSLKLSAGSIV